MNQPHYILLPVSPLFITCSLLCAFLLNLLPWGSFVGAPDFVALVLVFWGVHQPRKVGIGLAFFMGLLMDVHDATLLGENALAYTLLSYFAIMIHRRVLWFPILTQALHVFPLLVMTQAVQVLVRFIPARGADPDAHTREVIRRVQADGTCWLGGTMWQDKAAARISACSVVR